MSDLASDPVRWVERTLTIAPGVPLKLEPYQRTMLEGFARGLLDLADTAGRPIAVGAAVSARTVGRRRASARALALALALGRTPAAIAATDEAQARELLELAVAELERLGTIAGVDVEPLVKEVRASS